jgi:hypothetical protein
MQEIVFPGFKFQKFSGDYAPTHVAFGHWYPPLINSGKLEVTNARKLLPHGQNFGLACSKSGYNPWIIQK